ncbi:HNH endonuclease [Salipaludibacillus sp. CF4.18]|uniref:HNH endonuclease n=1 Tax=Salipaludibacillus sp. CF4.18 TaxID=3373081 RepID=UPI003EE42F1D
MGNNQIDLNNDAINLEQYEVDKYLLEDDIELTDSEVAEHWRIPWKPIEDEDSTDVAIKNYWNEKQRYLARMRKSKKRLLGGVFHTFSDGCSFLVDRNAGEIYRYNNNKYFYEIREGSIYLIEYNSNNVRLVYGDGEFSTSETYWLRNNKKEVSKNNCRGFHLPKGNIRQNNIYLKDHQIMAVLFWGQKIIENAIDGKDYDINHRNLDNDDNRPENLELVTKKENRQHATLMRKIRAEKYNNM